MTEGQKKILDRAFLLLVNGAKKGQRLVRDGATADDVDAHVGEMRAMIDEMHKSLSNVTGATAVLARAKPLSSSRPRPIPTT